MSEPNKFKEVKMPKGTICLCCHCGERYGGNAAGGCALYCSTCKTKPMRDKIDEENEQIKKERRGEI